VTNINLEDVMKIGLADDIWATRGKAIQAYAILEGSLCSLFQHLTGMDAYSANTVFFKITSQDVRNKIIEKLLKDKIGEKDRVCIISSLSKLRTLDHKRNELVHWYAATETSFSKMTVNVFLHHPADKQGMHHENKVTTDDMDNFIDECIFYVRLVNMFCMVMFQQNLSPDFQRQPWLDIYQQPVVYPPPITHPLYTKIPARNILLESFSLTD
jgi:hypothetical protein